jgi:hypothetical protein
MDKLKEKFNSYREIRQEALEILSDELNQEFYNFSHTAMILKNFRHVKRMPVDLSFFLSKKKYEVFKKFDTRVFQIIKDILEIWAKVYLQGYYPVIFRVGPNQTPSSNELFCRRFNKVLSKNCEPAFLQALVKKHGAFYEFGQPETFDLFASLMADWGLEYGKELIDDEYLDEYERPDETDDETDEEIEGLDETFSYPPQ